MKKLNGTKWILGSLSIVGAILVGQGLITGEELASVQNILGIALGSGGITTIGILTLLQAFPNTTAENLIKKVGKDNIDKGIESVEEILEVVKELVNKVDTLETKLNEQEEARNNLLNG